MTVSLYWGGGKEWLVSAPSILGREVAVVVGGLLLVGGEVDEGLLLRGVEVVAGLLLG